MTDPWLHPRTAYVHLPFCAHHCGYCDFAVTAGQDHLIELYLDALAAELATLGEPFGTAARLAEPVPLPLPTIAAPVRSPAEARRRLATAAHGTPIEPPGHHKLTCRVSPDGVAWS